MRNNLKIKDKVVQTGLTGGRKPAVEAGIGLVETLVAVAILGVTAVAFMTALSAGSISVNHMEQQATGQELARTQMETIKAAAYDLTGHSYTTVNAPDGYQVDIKAASDIYSNTDIQKITVEVAFHDQPLVRLESYKVNR